MVKKTSVSSQTIPEEAKELHFSVPVIDAHCDTLSRCAFRGRDMGRRQATGHIDLFKLDEGGVKAQVFAAFVHPSQVHRGYFNLAMRMNEALHKTAQSYPSRLRILLNRKDIDSLDYDKRIGALFGIEGAHSLEGRIENLYRFYDKGLRLVTLTWNNPNPFADSSAEKPVHGGLSPLGEKLVREMNKIGVIIDLSHASADTLKGVLKTSSKPILVSHSCCKAICNIHRNLADEQIRAVAREGGVIGVNFFPLFLDQDFLNTFDEKDNKRLDEYKKTNNKYGAHSTEAQKIKRQLKNEMFLSLPRVSYKRVVDHIERIVSIGGEDCVGLGSDFDGIMFTPAGMENASHLPKLTEEMLLRGWDKKRIRKILGLNMSRLFRKILPEY